MIESCCLSTAKDFARRLVGNGSLLFTKEKHGLSNVRLPWYCGLMFRTRQLSASLMSVELGTELRDDSRSTINIEVKLLVSILSLGWSASTQ